MRKGKKRQRNRETKGQRETEQQKKTKGHIERDSETKKLTENLDREA